MPPVVDLNEIPPVPEGTPATDVIVSLGFDPAVVQAVVITSEGIVGISAAIPDTPQPEPEPGPDPN
jgi:hypothetical protein